MVDVVEVAGKVSDVDGYAEEAFEDRRIGEAGSEDNNSEEINDDEEDDDGEGADDGERAEDDMKADNDELCDEIEALSSEPESNRL